MKHKIVPLSHMKILMKYMLVNKNKRLFYISLILSLLSAVLLVLSLFAMGKSVDIIQEIVIPIPFKDPPIKAFAINISLMAIFYFLTSIFNFIQNRIFVYISQNMGFQMRKDLFNKLQSLPFSYIDKKSTGDIMSCFTNDVDAIIFTLTQNAASTINAVFSVFAILVAMLLLNVILGAIALVITPLLLLLIFYFVKKSQPHFIDQQDKLGVINGNVEEMVAVHKMITAYGYEKKMVRMFAKENNSLAKSSYKAQLISGIIFPYNNFVNNLVVAIISLGLTVLLILSPNIFDSIKVIDINPASSILLFTLFLRQFTTPISTFFASINSFQLAFAAINRVNNVLEATDEVSQENKPKLVVPHGEIKFKNVDFRYEPDGKKIIKNLTLTLKPNTVNAIAGPTGSGKTTIISLLTKFYDIENGEILIDNNNINQVTRHSLRENISIVLQDSYLFSTTILENIRCAKPSATEAEVITAAKLSNAHDFIMRLPQGYQTKINNGIDLISEGEKQLIAIARAFLSKAKIIIFDEATSYVDTKTEKDIQQAMYKLIKNRTAILIAHRLSTIKDADQIAIVKNGVLIEKGNHQTLMRKKGFYYKLNASHNDDIDLDKKLV